MAHHLDASAGRRQDLELLPTRYLCSSRVQAFRKSACDLVSTFKQKSLPNAATNSAINLINLSATKDWFTGFRLFRFLLASWIRDDKDFIV